MDYGIIDAKGNMILKIASQVQGDVLYYNGTNWVRLPPGTSGQFLKTNGAAANPAWASATATDLSISGQAQGDVLYFNGTNWVRLAAGTAGQTLRTEGAAANPTFGFPTSLTIASQAQGDVLYYNGTSWTRLAAGTAGKVLRTEGAAANPTFGYPADLSIASAANGDIIYYNGTNWVRLAAGTAGQKLQTNGAAAPSWVTSSASALTLLSSSTGTTATATGKITIAASKQYHVRFRAKGASSAGFTMLTFYDSGSEVTTGYKWTLQRFTMNTTVTETNTGQSSSTRIPLMSEADSIGSSPDGYNQGWFNIDTYKVDSTTSATVDGQATFRENTGVYRSVEIHGVCAGNFTIDGFQLAQSTGSMDYRVNVYELSQS